jgi:hypothetical protein
VSEYHVAFLAAAVMVAIGAALPALLLRRRHTVQVDGESAQDDVDAAVESPAALSAWARGSMIASKVNGRRVARPGRACAGPREVRDEALK